MPRKNRKTPRNDGARSVGQYKTRAKRHGETQPEPEVVKRETVTDEQLDALDWDWIFSVGVK